MLGETYIVDPKVEAQWIALGTAIAGIAGVLMASAGVDDTLAVALAPSLGAFIAGVLRVVVGHFMPTPKAGQ
jgi:hypothetical protein